MRRTAQEHNMPPRLGRPPAPIDPATLPPYARVLRAALAHHATTREAAAAVGTGERSLRKLLNGETPNPGIGTLAPLLAAIRPDDADGGWGWFGRELQRV